MALNDNARGGPRRFAVALSYPGERGEFVSKIAACLAEKLGEKKILYDKYLAPEFARPNLDVYLPNLYHTESDLIVIFLCNEYSKKRWCKLEWRSIRQLIETADEDRIMFLSFDEIGAIPELGIVDGDGYFSIGTRSPAEICSAILQRRGSGASSRAVSRVCFISSEYPPNVLGGLGVHVHQLTMALSKHIDIDVVLASEDKKRYVNTNPRVRLQPLANDKPSYGNPISWLYFANHAADKIIRSARDSRPDVIHCHDWVTVLPGIICRWQLNIPLVFHLHLPNRNQLCAAVENLGLVCADLVTVNSEAMYEDLKKREVNNRRLPLRRVEVVKNGVDIERFVPCDDWPADDGFILFVGRLVEQKGVEYLLRALSFVKEKFPRVSLKIVGDGELRPALERLCKNLMLSRQVEFLGWKTEEELTMSYKKAQVVIVPSIYEPFGMTALEALACQRPVVASRVGGLRDIVLHGKTGFLAEPKDDLDLAQWIMTLLSSTDLRNEMGKAGREFVIENGYTWPQIAEQFMALYEQILAKPPENDVPDMVGEIKQIILEEASKLDPSVGDGLFDQLFHREG